MVSKAADLPLVSSSASDLPFDVLSTKILCRLPRKSLKRFECVSKSWCRLIQSPYFLSLHSQQYKYNTNLDIFVLHGAHLRLLGLNKTSTVDVVDYSLNLSDYIDIPRDCGSLQIYGPRNGMYCLYSKHWDNRRKITLMSSSLKEFKVVPVPQHSIIFQLPPVESPRTALEFGFDPKTNDYKVVLFRSWFERGIQRYQTAAELFSLNTNSWKKLNDVPCLEISLWRSSTISAPYVNENFHWLAKEDECIVAFDMVSEVFRKFKLPKLQDNPKGLPVFLDRYRKFKLPKLDRYRRHLDRVETLGTETLAVYNGCLSVLVQHPPPNCDSKFCFDIWIMRDYGKDESWTKHCTIAITIPHVSIRLVLGFWQNDEQVILMDWGRRPEIFLYDLCTQNLEKISDADCVHCKFQLAHLDALPGAKSQAGIM